MSAKDLDRHNAGKLFNSPSDWLAALPAPDVVGDDVWKEVPVDLETWLYDAAYMNLSDIRLSEKQIDALRAMDDIDPATNITTELILEWGKGSGKDFISALGGLRQVYKLLCLRDPYAFYGMAKNTGIQIVNVAYTKEQAKFVYLKQVKGLLRGSRWFARIKWAITRERILFPHDIEFVSTSADGDGAEGQNIFFAVMDEASAFKTANNVKSMNKADGQKADRDAESIYRVLRTSANSRFPHVGKVVIISYPRYRDDFIQQKRKENENSPSGWTSGPWATWDVNPRVTRESFADDYRKDPEMAEAMYECKPPFSVDGYVKYPQRFLECIARGKTMGLRSPVDASGVYDLGFSGIPGRFYAIHIDLALNKDKCALTLARQGEPVKRLKCPCNAFNLKDIERCATCGREVSRWIETELPTMVVTLLKYFTSGPKGEINFADVRDEVLWLRDRGHKIWALSYDGWQSVDSRQIMSDNLGERPVKDRWGKQMRTEPIVSLLSVDRNTEAHDTLKEFIYDERFFIYGPDGMRAVSDMTVEADEAATKPETQALYDHPVSLAFREWRALRLINGKKIDHPAGGSKDLIDSLAGAALHVSRMPISRYRSPVVGGWRESPRGG